MTGGTVRLLERLRDGWLDSATGPGLVNGPFVDRSDIDALAMSTGWGGRHLSEAVRRAFAPYDDGSLRAMCTDDRAAASGTELLAILAGRVPALAARVLFHGLAAGVRVTLKPSSAEPVFARLLARSILALDPGAAVSIAPEDRAALARVTGTAPLCLVYGSDATVAAVSGLRHGLPTLTGPHMESFAVVFADAIDTVAGAAAVAGAIALDTVIYDQDGCLSPVAVLVQEGGTVTPSKFAELLLNAMLASPYAPGRSCVDDLAAVRLFERESSLTGGHEAVIRGSAGVPPLVAVVDTVRPGPGLRTLQVAGFSNRHIPDLAALIPHLRGRVQGLATAGTPDETEALLSANPEFRPNHLCGPGLLQDPPAMWKENGIVLCRELRKIA